MILNYKYAFTPDIRYLEPEFEDSIKKEAINCLAREIYSKCSKVVRGTEPKYGFKYIEVQVDTSLLGSEEKGEK